MNDEFTEVTTRFSLDREYVNQKSAPYVLVTDLDTGKTAKNRVSISKEVKALLLEKRIDCEKKTEDRVVDSKTKEVGEHTIIQDTNKPLEYFFKGVSEGNNALIYFDIIEILKNAGYVVTFISCKRNTDCRDPRVYRMQTIFG